MLKLLCPGRLATKQSSDTEPDKEERTTDIPGAGGLNQHIHPLVWIHPRTGQPAVMAHTLILEGLRHKSTREAALWSWEKSQATIAEMIAPACRPPHIYCHCWRPGDLVVWDNFCSLHTITPYEGKAGYKTAGGTRLMHRLSIGGQWNPV